MAWLERQEHCKTFSIQKQIQKHMLFLKTTEVLIWNKTLRKL